MSTTRTVQAVSMAALVAGSLCAAPAVAAAGTTEVTGASFEWSLNNTTQKEWPFPGAGTCHYLSAGVSDGTEASYRAVDGNVAIVRAGVTPTFADRCTLTNGLVDQKVVLSGGTGKLDPESGKVKLVFSGSFTANWNGGQSPFTFSNLAVAVKDGTGVVTADMSSTITTPTAVKSSKRVIVANLVDVDSANSTGFTSTPRFFGVTAKVAGTNPEEPKAKAIVPSAAVQDGKGAGNWGSWPQKFMTFIYRTGVNSYFHSSNVSPSSAGDARKPANAVSVSYGLAG